MLGYQNTIVIDQQLEDLEKLASQLRETSDIQKKIDFLDQLPAVRSYLSASPPFSQILNSLDTASCYAVKSILAIYQGPHLFNQAEKEKKKFALLIEYLVSLESFYSEIGGIIGYQLEILRLLKQQSAPPPLEENVHYIQPEGLSLSDNLYAVNQAVRLGIENLPKIGEIYPVGGAGDRLNLLDDKTDTPLPAAALPFLGKSLLEGLIRDVQAREFLHYRLFEKQPIIPIAMMTSSEKNNHAIILSLCEQAGWFGRKRENFTFFMQPLAPLITEAGLWSLSAPLTLALKPGGHGVIWKLAEDQGVFSWFDSKEIRKGLVRQINNPVAGTDQALLALCGIGCSEEKSFGFVSCERLVNAAEGTNVVIETRQGKSFGYKLTNIEYTDFAKHGIKDEPAVEGSPYSAYPANTNILFIDIPSIQEAIKTCPLPGKIINLKSKVSFIDSGGKQHWVKGGRLETTMQNIADFMIDCFPNRLQKGQFDQLRNFIIFNERSKTISTTKQAYQRGQSPNSTPEQAYFDILNNHRHLFEKKCLYSLPAAQSFEEYIEKGPNCILLFNPALGPLFSILQQKMRKGHLCARSEMQLEIAEARIENIRLEGSLLVTSLTPLGSISEEGTYAYGFESRCFLENVIIENKGIDFQETKNFWKNDIKRHESVSILLGEGSEFYAKNIWLIGNHEFEVPPRHRMILSTHKDGSLVKKLVKIERPSWQWNYSFDEMEGVKLSFLLNDHHLVY
ncbi:MAG: UTP--glucose-1-phosphate uridylyltransferase [Parachlamydia sp.]|jgi:hypothetical protein|nr:UTP--glucose-1-phosphate uridylyltransferase [Parachlamydia sp.]